MFEFLASNLSTKDCLLQEDFDEFDDVDMLYNTLPLDKGESLEDLVTIVPPAPVKVDY